MTNVDGLTLPVRVAIAGDAFDLACDYARSHKLTISEAVSQMLRQVAPLVEDRASLPVSPGDGREGAATATAAPSVLEPIRSEDIPIFCTTHRYPPYNGRGPLHRAKWWVGPTGSACCDEHIPDGWVKPDDVPLTLEESKALHPSSRPVVEYVKACVYCGERSQHGRCS